MSSFETSYPLEIVHMDFLTIGSKKDPNKDINVLVITDHFIRYAQAFVTTSQTAVVVALISTRSILYIMVGQINYAAIKLVTLKAK